MYRCRRLIAVVLSLAVVASAFVLSAYADEEEFNRGFFYVGQYMVFLDNGNGATFTLNPGETKTITIPSIKLSSNTLQSNESLAVNFQIRVYVYFNGSQDIVHSALVPRNYNGYTSSKGSMSLITHYDNDYPNFVPNEYNLDQYGYMCSFLFTDTNTVNLNLTCDWYNASQSQMIVFYRVEELSISSSFNYFSSSILMPVLNTIANTLSIQNNKLFTESYTYTQITYDSNGNASAFNVMGNWVTAVLGSLKSLVAPIKNQVNQEQKAKDAGAYDALDDAYDHSSFLSFLDFTSFADFGEYDSDDLDEINDDSYSVWFSNMTKNDLDTVVQTRGQDDDFISYYEDHMQEIENSVGSMLGGGD